MPASHLGVCSYVTINVLFFFHMVEDSSNPVGPETILIQVVTKKNVKKVEMLTYKLFY